MTYALEIIPPIILVKTISVKFRNFFLTHFLDLELQLHTQRLRSFKYNPRPSFPDHFTPYIFQTMASPQSAKKICVVFRKPLTGTVIGMLEIDSMTTLSAVSPILKTWLNSCHRHQIILCHDEKLFDQD